MEKVNDPIVFTDEALATVKASMYSEETENYIAVIGNGNGFVHIEEKNPKNFIVHAHEILVAVYKDGDQVDWSEIY